MDKSALLIYSGVFSALIAAGLGFPIPEELPIVTGGALCGLAAQQNSAETAVPKAVAHLAADPSLPFPASVPWSSLGPDGAPVGVHWWIMLPLLILGVVVSDSLLYGIGRFWGPRLLDRRWMKKLLSADKRQRIEENFQRYGVWVLLFARFLPTIRGPIFIMAGVVRLPLTRFALFDGIYAIPGVSLLFFLAYWFGHQIIELVEAASGKVSALRPILILLLLVAVTIYLIYHFVRHPVATGDPRQELPVIGEQVAKEIERELPKRSALWTPIVFLQGVLHVLINLFRRNNKNEQTGRRV